MTKINNKGKNFVLVMLIMFVIANVMLVIEVSGLTAELVDYQRKEAVLISENRRLSGTLLRETSLTSLAVDAENLGFAKPENLVYISREEAVANLR